MNPVDLPSSLAYESNEAKPMMTLATIPTPAVFTPRPFPAIMALEGGETVKKPTQFKKGIVTVTEGQTPTRGAAYWELRYVDPDTGREIKRRVSGLDRGEVEAMADHLTRQAYQGKGYLAGQSKTPTIADGILEAVRLSRQRDCTKAESVRVAQRFVRWLAGQYPAVKTWGDLRPGMVEAYIRDCERAGMAWDTVRNRIVPVRQAWRRMRADYPESVKAPPVFKLAAPPRREIVCLESGEVAALLDWFKTHAKPLWPMACLQALAGLRMLEAAALRVQDIDLKAATVAIADTGNHKPKTRDSFRVIPVCGEVVDALRVTLAGQKVRPATGELFVNDRGNLWTVDSLNHAWTRTLRHAAARPKVIERANTGKRLTLNRHGLDMPWLALIPPHRLRSSFATTASKAGVPDRLLKCYLGHAAGDILGGHYRRIDLDELRTVSSLLDSWRTLAKGADARKDSGITPPLEIANG